MCSRLFGEHNARDDADKQPPTQATELSVPMIYQGRELVLGGIAGVGSAELSLQCALKISLDAVPERGNAAPKCLIAQSSGRHEARPI